MAAEQALQAILQQHRVWRGAAAWRAPATVASGYDGLDAELGGGWPTGALTELLPARKGIGELQLIVPALAALSQAGRRILWLAPPHLPYAPALIADGVDLAQLAVVRAPGRRDALWAAEQALRAGSCHALLAWFPHARYPELRRLAVAAEASRVLVTLFRPPEAAREASPAVLRMALEPASDGALDVRILKRRGRPAALPLRVPVKRPVHALGRSAFPPAAGTRIGERRSVGVPVHA